MSVCAIKTGELIRQDKRLGQEMTGFTVLETNTSLSINYIPIKSFLKNKDLFINCVNSKTKQNKK